MTGVGWVSAVALGLCGLPQAWQCYVQGHGKGLSLGFLSLWLVGEVTGMIYVWDFGSAPLLANYAINILWICTILRYRFFPRVKAVRSNVIPIRRTR